jgi:hypothetical protein
MGKSLTTILIITALSILYVFQHAALIEQSYNINIHEKAQFLLIDQNKKLRYNIARLEAPAHLEEQMAVKRQAELSMPVNYYKIAINQRFQTPYETVAGVGRIVNAGRFFVSMFSLEREAVADSIDNKF